MIGAKLVKCRLTIKRIFRDRCSVDANTDSHNIFLLRVRKHRLTNSEVNFEQYSSVVDSSADYFKYFVSVLIYLLQARTLTHYLVAKGQNN